MHLFSSQKHKSTRSNPADTGRKLNVHKTFRKRLVRLLNVLCTFNLRSVSTWKNHLLTNDSLFK